MNLFAQLPVVILLLAVKLRLLEVFRVAEQGGGSEVGRLALHDCHLWQPMLGSLLD